MESKFIGFVVNITFPCTMDFRLAFCFLLIVCVYRELSGDSREMLSMTTSQKQLVLEVVGIIFSFQNGKSTVNYIILFLF